LIECASAFHKIPSPRRTTVAADSGCRDGDADVTLKRPPGFIRRLALGMSGQALLRVVLAFYTVVLVPLLIRAWGVSGYGQWIALTALASYMSLSNFGLVATSAYEMVIASGADDSARARRTYQASINLTIYIVLPLITLAVLILSHLPVSSGLHLTEIDPRSAEIIIACSGATLLFQTLRGLNAAALYATGSYGFAYYVQAAMKLLELSGIAVLVSRFSGSQVSAAAVIAGVAFVELLIIGTWARRAAPWARLNLRVIDKGWLLQQAKPTLGFLLSNFATQGIMAQGPRVLLGAILGGEAVAVYAVYGTAMRMVDQLLLMLMVPLQVEIAHYSGREDLGRIERLVIVGTHVSWALFLFVALGLMCFGPVIFHVWTTGRIPFSYGLMALYLCMSAANMQGRVSLQALTSTNRLYGLSFVMLGFAVMAVGLGGLLAPTLGVAGMVLGGLTGEIANSAAILVKASRWLQKPFTALAEDLLSFRSSMAELRTRSQGMLSRLRPSLR
jgi:O-antigen/teichoic acid export membrane protein